MKIEEALQKLQSNGLAVTKSGNGILGGSTSQTYNGITAYDHGFVIEPQGNQWLVIVSQERDFDYEATFTNLEEAVDAVCEKVVIEVAA